MALNVLVFWQNFGYMVSHFGDPMHIKISSKNPIFLKLMIYTRIRNALDIKMHTTTKPTQLLD